MSEPITVTTEISIDRGLIMKTSVNLLALINGLDQDDLKRVLSSKNSDEEMMSKVADLYESAELHTNAGMLKMAIILLELSKTIFENMPKDATTAVFGIAAKLCGAIKIAPEESHFISRLDDAGTKVAQYIHGDNNL